MTDEDRNSKHRLPWLAMASSIILFLIMSLGILIMMNYGWSLRT